MKTTTAFLTALLASASCVTAASVPNQARHIADGLYQVSVDDAGNKNTKFTPIDQVSESPTPRSESPLEKRREGCGPGSGDANAANDAVSCLKNSFLTDPVYFNANAWTYCVSGDVVAFICPYSTGYKSKDDLQRTFDDIGQRCGLSIMGYEQIEGGQGDMTAGYALKTDNFCTSDFHIGD